MQFGKDLLSDYLKDRLNEREGHETWVRSAFAKAVKDIFCKTFGKDVEYLEKWKVSPDVPPDLDMTVRKALQFIGDGFRQIKGSIWIDLVFRDSQKNKILADGRYLNELKAVKEHGGFNILIVRPDKLNNDPNGSEAQVKPLVEYAMSIHNMKIWKYITPPYGMEYIDHIVYNDGTIEDLYYHIDNELVPRIEEFFNAQKRNDRKEKN
jgi:hypothetical protein